MAHPKRKHSRARRDKKRTHIKISDPALSLCPSCGQPKAPHHVCDKCGVYKGKQYVEIKEKKPKK